MTRERIAMLGVAAAVIALGVGLGSTLSRIEYATTADEGHYLGYARLLVAQGPTGVREAFEGYVADENRWRFPNPLRLAYHGMTASWLGVRGGDFRALSELSLVAHLLLVLGTFAALRGPLGATRSALVAVSVGCSPLLLALARRALMDGVACWKAARPSKSSCASPARTD